MDAVKETIDDQEKVGVEASPERGRGRRLVQVEATMVLGVL